MRVFIAETKIILPGYVLDIVICYSRAFNTNGEGEGYLFEPKSRSILSGTINNPQILYFLAARGLIRNVTGFIPYSNLGDLLFRVNKGDLFSIMT
jgi:hypothetical protein